MNLFELIQFSYHYFSRNLYSVISDLQNLQMNFGHCDLADS